MSNKKKVQQLGPKPLAPAGGTPSPAFPFKRDVAAQPPPVSSPQPQSTQQLGPPQAPLERKLLVKITVEKYSDYSIKTEYHGEPNAPPIDELAGLLWFATKELDQLYIQNKMASMQDELRRRHEAEKKAIDAAAAAAGGQPIVSAPKGGSA